MATIDIQQLIEYLERLINKAMRIPGGKVVLDQAELTNLIEQMRLALPTEIRQAQQILAERQQILGQAHEESSSLLRQAQTKAAQNLADHSLVRQAEEQTQSMLAEAQEEAANIINGADDYAEESLRQLAQSVSQLNSVIQNGLHALANRRSKRVQKTDGASNPNANEVQTEPAKQEPLITASFQRRT
ncbi:MAG: ATP synthase subunit B family protein [Anaerolineae bacterium]